MIRSTAATVTYLFSDIEGSTRLWESDAARAARTLAWHDETSRAIVARHHGTVVKMTGDGVHAAFEEAADALDAAIDLQLALTQAPADHAALRVRCGLHLGTDEHRDNDYFGPAVNRAARIMSAAHGGQVLLSRAVAERIGQRLPGGVALRDLGFVRLRDLGSPEYLYQLVHPALRADFPPLRSMASTPNNLAQQLNSFIGRDRDMAQVRQLLANSRLLTLLGMGGLGKSRLSVQVAAIVLDSYPDGVWFVELAALADPALVPQAVANVVGVKEEPGGSVMDALRAFVADRQLLFVLDNCEHVVQACADLARQLLQAGPGVRVLASSRDALRIAGETVFPVAPLPAPERNGAPSLDALIAVDSVRLFLDRARAVQPKLRLGEDAVRAAAEICRRLDGIPLALELAAARVRSMTIEQIAGRLDDRFRLLNRGDRTALPRQQTLRALIDWSYDLLDAKERALFQRLSVFAGGCTLEAAEAVCAGGELATVDVVDALADLVEKSLVALEPERSRYRMLDTVRQYAAERLDETQERASVESRLVTWFVALAEEARPELVTTGQREWLARLDEERDNLVAAHRACDHAADGSAAGLRLVYSLKLYWLSRGALVQGYTLACEALARDRSGVAELTVFRGLLGAGALATFMGRYAEARAALGEALSLAAVGDGDEHIGARQLLIEVELALGDRAAAFEHANEAERLARAAGGRILAVALVGKGQLLRLAGDMPAAEAAYGEARGIGAAVGDEEVVAISLLNLAIVAIVRGDAATARSHLASAAGIAERLLSQAAGQSLLEVCAGLALLQADVPSARYFLLAAQAQATRSGLSRDPADQAFYEDVVGRVGVVEAPDAEMPDYEAAMRRAAEWLQGAPH